MLEDTDIRGAPPLFLVITGDGLLNGRTIIAKEVSPMVCFLTSQVDFQDVQNLPDTPYRPAVYFCMWIMLQISKTIDISSPIRCLFQRQASQTPLSYRLGLSLTAILYLCRIAITWKEYRSCLWPGGVIQREDISHFEESQGPFLNPIAYGIGALSDRTNWLGFLEWHQVILETLCVNTSLHHLKTLQVDFGPTTLMVKHEGTPLTSYIIGSIHRWLHRTQGGSIRSSIIHTALKEWLSLLKECRIDLWSYGNEERKVLREQYFVNSRLGTVYFGWPSACKGGNFLPKLKDIRYGPEIEDWSLVLDMEVEEFVGEFWDWVEAPQFPMPGGWIDE